MLPSDPVAPKQCDHLRELSGRSRLGLADRDIHGSRGGKLAIKRLAARYFGDEFVYRKKIGFSAPFGDWCSDPAWWRDYVEKLDLDLLGTLMDPSILRTALSLAEGREKWSGRNLNLIFSLVNLQLWHEIFIQGSDPLSQSAWHTSLPPTIRDELANEPGGGE